MVGMKTRIHVGEVSMLLAVVLSVSAVGQSTTSTAPASGAMSVQITGVEGMVQVRESGDAPWKAAKVGMVVGEGAEFRTGPRSAVRCLIPPDQTITLDRLGVIKLMQALQEKNVIKTKVGMPYGRTRYDIEEAGVEHQSELVTPSSTLAVRGTVVSVYDQPPFAPSAVSLTGRAEYRTAKRQIAFGGKGQGKTQVSSETDSAAAGSLLRSFVDPTSNYGRPKEEQQLINQLQAKGDLVLNNGRLALAFGGAVSDAQLLDFISGQGRFNITMRWFGPGDFDLFVLTPDPTTNLPAYTLGNPSYAGSVFKDIGLFGDTNTPPVTAARTPDGGQIKFDQIAFGGGGIELASWNTPVPQVGYTVAVVYYDHRDKDKKYPLRQRFQVDAFLDGKRVPVLTNFDEIVRGEALELKFGPTYAGTSSLLDEEKILVVDPPEKLKGDIRLTAVDLSAEATYVDGTPIGNINPGVHGVQASVKKSGKTVAKRSTPSPVVNKPVATVRAPVKR